MNIEDIFAGVDLTRGRSSDPHRFSLKPTTNLFCVLEVSEQTR